MTSDFGGFDKIDPDKIIKQAQQQMAKMGDVQEKLKDVVGKAASEDGYVKVTYTVSGGLEELELNPRAMRMASADLAETIKKVVRDAANDLQRQIREQMKDMFAGQDNPMDYLDDPQKAVEQTKEIQGMLNGAIGDAQIQMERMRRQLGL